MLLEWEAFDRLQPIGEQQMDQRFKALGAWLCTMLSQSGNAFSPDDIKGISPEIPDSVAASEEPIEDDPDDLEIPTTASSADVLRDYREQSIFR